MSKINTLNKPFWMNMYKMKGREKFIEDVKLLRLSFSRQVAKGELPKWQVDKFNEIVNEIIRETENE